MSILNNKKQTKEDKAVPFAISDIAKEYGIKISQPKGYFPSDVDDVLENLKNQISQLEQENEHLKQSLAEKTDAYNKLEASAKESMITYAAMGFDPNISDFSDPVEENEQTHSDTKKKIKITFGNQKED